MGLATVIGDRNVITIEPDKRSGKPYIRRMRITAYDVLEWLAAGISHIEILEDFSELTEADIWACLEFAADREHRLVVSVDVAWSYCLIKLKLYSYLEQIPSKNVKQKNIY